MAKIRPIKYSDGQTLNPKNPMDVLMESDKIRKIVIYTITEPSHVTQSLAAVEPRHNEPLYHEGLGKTNSILQLSYSKMYGKKPL